MSKPPIPTPSGQSISGAFMLEDRPSWIRRRGWGVTLAVAVVVTILALLLVLDTRAKRAAQEAAYIPPELSAAEGSAVAAHALEKAESDARAAEQVRRDTAGAEGAAEARRAQDPEAPRVTDPDERP
jgi:cytoskeletal protein RodZ